MLSPREHLPEDLLVAHLRELRDVEPAARHARAWSWIREIYAFIRSVARRLRFAEDVVQDAALVLHVRARDGKLNAELVREPGPWLRQVVKRALRDAARREERYQGRVDDTRDVEALAGSAMPEEAGEEPQDMLVQLAPIERLVLLAAEAPHLIVEGDVCAAAAASQPPRVGLSREPAATWRGIRDWRARPKREPRELHFLLRAAPEVRDVESWSEADAVRARDWAYQRVHVAREALKRDAAGGVIGRGAGSRGTRVAPRRRPEARGPGRAVRR